jgi:ketosteroid isomerase-like protein
MITKEQANKFANDWVASWNTHDLDRVMSHYDDNVEYYSQFVLKLTDNKSGMLQGKNEVQQYLAKALQTYPDLHFKLIAAEVFEINSKGLAARIQCHYYQS